MPPDDQISAPLDHASSVPLYHQIVVILTSRMTSGALRPGDTMPGEAAICTEFGVSRITARRALNELAAMGRVVRERGRGTRVVPHKKPPSVSATLDGLMENVGHMGRMTSVKVLDFRYLAATPDMAEKLDLAEAAMVQRAVRVRYLGDEAMSYLVTVVPEQIGRKVDGMDMSQTPLLLLLEAAGVPVASATQTIGATVADTEVAQALGVAAGTPLLEVNRLVLDDQERPVEMIRVLYRPDLYRFEVAMQRVDDQSGRSWRAEAPERLRSL